MTTIVTISTILFALAGFAKVVGLEASQAQREDLRVPEGLWRIIGVLELLGAAAVGGSLLGYVPVRLGEIAAAGFVLLMVGAIVTRIKTRSNPGLVVFDLFALGIAIATVWTLDTLVTLN
jgi:hypothetical protein